MNIIITGGTKGIGRAIADLFAANQFNVAVCARTAADLETMADDYKNQYLNIQFLPYQADLRHKSEVLKFADFIKANWPAIDVLVNNSGVFKPGAIHTEPEGALEQMVETNLYSAYHLTRALVGGMIERKQGHIFNMCSIASLHAYPDGGSYSISKFALLGFSKNLREELKERGIRVTAILPGATWSASWAGVELPESRLMQAHDIAIAVWAAYSMSPSAVVEDIVIRPQLGDL
ncbi:MAG: SDR family oxidoreductase [Phaeodactylibacter sp.]|nr:SDR family oxidoreductase [Phaeodactylibacter sp.]